MTLLKRLRRRLLGTSTLVRLGLLAVALPAAVAVVAVLIAAAGDDGSPAVVALPTPEPTQTPEATAQATVIAGDTATPAPTTTATAEPTPEPTSEPTPEPTPEPVRSVDELVRRFGDPVDASLARLRIPALGVDAAVGTRTVGGDGVMPLPHGPADMVWYDMSQWTGLGGTIGAGGNALLAGHVDFAAQVRYAGQLGFADVAYRGGGVLIALNQLVPGDVIEIDFEGETLRYVVTWNRKVAADDLPAWPEIFSDDVAVDSITLITCGGIFDFDTRSYADRWVVRAERA